MVSNITVVREALEKIVHQGAIGTVNLPRCIEYLRTAETAMTKQQHALDSFRDLLRTED